jgi:hypothetical protein
MAIVPSLLAGAPAVDVDEIHALLQQKDAPELARVTTALPAEIRDALLALTGLYSSVPDRSAGDP